MRASVRWHRIDPSAGRLWLHWWGSGDRSGPRETPLIAAAPRGTPGALLRAGRDDQGDDIATALDRLHAVGWSVGDTAFHDVERGGLVWVVIGSNGENRIRAEGATRVAANAHSVIARTTAVVMPRPQSFLAEPVADLGEMAEDVTV